MKRLIIRALVFACVGALCVGLAGCGSGSDLSASSSTSKATSSSSARSAKSSSAAAADDHFNPAKINPGWLDGDVRTSDVWYRDGDTSAEGIYFLRADNDAGLSFTRVDANNNDGESELDLIITSNKHLRTRGGQAPKIDIVFRDEMNCYDYVSGEFYCRGDLEKLTSMIDGKTYVMKGHNVEVSFKNDGSCIETVDGESETGKWKVAATTVVEMAYDSDGYVVEYRLTINGNSVPQIMDSNGNYYDLKS